MDASYGRIPKKPKALAGFKNQGARTGARRSGASPQCGPHTSYAPGPPERAVLRRGVWGRLQQQHSAVASKWTPVEPAGAPTRAVAPWRGFER